MKNGEVEFRLPGECIVRKVMVVRINNITVIKLFCRDIKGNPYLIMRNIDEVFGETELSLIGA